MFSLKTDSVLFSKSPTACSWWWWLSHKFTIVTAQMFCYYWQSYNNLFMILWGIYSIFSVPNSIISLLSWILWVIMPFGIVKTSDWIYLKPASCIKKGKIFLKAKTLVLWRLEGLWKLISISELIVKWCLTTPFSRSLMSIPHKFIDTKIWMWEHNWQLLEGSLHPTSRSSLLSRMS